MALPGNIGIVSAKAFSQLLSGPAVEVYVGKEKTHWSIPRNLLCYHSRWIKNELLPEQQGDPNPKEKKADRDTLTLDLEDVDPAGFELFVKWMFQGKLDDVDTIPDIEAKYEYAVACHKLYSLCERLEVAELKNTAMDQYRKGLRTTSVIPDVDEIDRIYRASPAGSPFRSLMTHIAARQIMDPDGEKDAEHYRECFEDNPDFCADLLNSIREGSGGIPFKDPTHGDDCAYHEHPDGRTCRFKRQAGSDSPTLPGQAGGARIPRSRLEKMNPLPQQQPFNLPPILPRLPDHVSPTTKSSSNSLHHMRKQSSPAALQPAPDLTSRQRTVAFATADAGPSAPAGNNQSTSKGIIKQSSSSSSKSGSGKAEMDRRQQRAAREIGPVRVGGLTGPTFAQSIKLAYNTAVNTASNKAVGKSPRSSSSSRQNEGEDQVASPLSLTRSEVGSDETPHTSVDSEPITATASYERHERRGRDKGKRSKGESSKR